MQQLRDANNEVTGYIFDKYDLLQERQEKAMKLAARISLSILLIFFIIIMSGIIWMVSGFYP